MKKKYKVEEFIQNDETVRVVSHNLSYVDKQSMIKGFSFIGWGIKVKNNSHYIVVKPEETLFSYKVTLITDGRIRNIFPLHGEGLEIFTTRYYLNFYILNEEELEGIWKDIQKKAVKDDLPRVYASKNSKKLYMVYS